MRPTSYAPWRLPGPKVFRPESADRAVEDAPNGAQREVRLRVSGGQETDSAYTMIKAHIVSSLT
jgi:hypothetical protein